MGMDTATLDATVNRMVGRGKVLFATDESPVTVRDRVEKAGIEPTPDNIMDYRLVLATADDLRLYGGGAILHPDTLVQRDGEIVRALLERGVALGVKVDLGLKKFDGSDETYTSGLEDGHGGELRRRVAEYKGRGAVFAKWRASLLISASDKFPSSTAIERNANDLAVYARICQEDRTVPIVEPEVRADAKGYDTHTIDECLDATRRVQKAVFKALKKEGVYLPGMVLKPNMITPGVNSRDYKSAKPEIVSRYTVMALAQQHQLAPQISVDAFLSGGQGAEAFSNLNAIRLGADREGLWYLVLTASFGRQFVSKALKLYGGKMENAPSAHEAIGERLKAAAGASIGVLNAWGIAAFKYAEK